MLSRIAESLYWLGRHVERADCTARLVDAYLPVLPSAGWRIDHRAADPLISALGLVGSGYEDPSLLLHPLVFDRSSTSSVSGALTAARENARGVRDVLPATIWEALNITWHTVRSAASTTSGPHEYLRWVRERCAVVAGLVDEVMSRDEGWNFLVVGRSLERADMGIRLIAATVSPGAPSTAWRTLLLAIGGWEPYMRASGGAVGPASAVQFVLLDRLFPRSVLRCLTTAESVLGDLESIGRSTGPDPRRDPSSARRVIGRARTGLDYWLGSDASQDPAALLGALHRSVDAAHGCINRTFFEQVTPVRWASMASGGAA